ncbi:MAG: 4-hydroxy-tetrahydrodipicolinate reductase, partial [Proteobacteria bacterium]|nr:4-hydroxy-tetrahydrodipicolinate reductase [Pseudomonadota bacterium]
MSSMQHAPINASADSASTLRIVLHGAMGRMGQRIAASIPAERGCHIIQAIDRDDELRVAAGEADVVIDFSSDEGAARAAQAATALGCALLVGTTGLSQASLEAIERASARVPAMVAPNTSLGVAVTRRLVTEAARLLPGFDIDIVETHHMRKLDAPSGTARSLAEAVARGTGKPMNPARIHAIRAGDVIGEHVVTYSGAGERVIITHAATSRDLFALGALRMA